MKFDAYPSRSGPNSYTFNDMPKDSEEPADVYALLRAAAEARLRAAKAMLSAYEANAFRTPATPEDIAYWKQELADVQVELARLHSAHRT
ncbi:hypothetical protein [Mesorhizobium sp. P5_C1]